MCTYNVKIEDEVVELVKPHFEGDAAMELWIEKQLKRIMLDFAAQFKKARGGDNLLKQLQDLDDTPDGFLKLDTVLPPSSSSERELREDAYFEKYGI